VEPSCGGEVNIINLAWHTTQALEGFPLTQKTDTSERKRPNKCIKKVGERRRVEL
jgi:hypothetical protein